MFAKIYQRQVNKYYTPNLNISEDLYTTSR